tara:strand:- start:31 stop:723 length:693 start_codon:yes stop_codon:yes gene_type:complete
MADIEDIEDIEHILENVNTTFHEKLDILESVNINAVKENNIDELVDIYEQLKTIFKGEIIDIINISLTKLILSCHFGDFGCESDETAFEDIRDKIEMCETMIIRNAMNPSLKTIKDGKIYEYEQCLNDKNKLQLNCHNYCSRLREYNPRELYLIDLIKTLTKLSKKKIKRDQDLENILEVIENIEELDKVEKINETYSDKIAESLENIYKLNSKIVKNYKFPEKISYFMK